MGWRDLIANEGETEVLPWIGGGALHSASRVYKVKGWPREHGWYRFQIEGSRALHPEPADPVPEMLRHSVSGYLVGDRFVADDARIDLDPADIVRHSERVHLVPDQLDRFSRVRAGRVYPEGPLIFREQDFPLGPEEEVLDAYLEERRDVTGIPGVVPALDAAFRMETFQRDEAERRRQEILRRRAEEEARREQERRRQELLEKLGDGAGRRAMAWEGDFKEAAKAALEVGGARYLDHREGARRDEWVVTYSVNGRRLQCVCDTHLHVIDAGICLVDHDTGEKGDAYFTLESLPSVVRQAVREGKLVVWRHV